MLHRSVLPLVLLASAASGWAAVPPDHAAQMMKGVELFNRDVAKLLTEHCVKCHGGEKGTKGGLDLATREALMKGGDEGVSIIPGKSAESLLVRSIRHEEEDIKMPKKADKLSDADIAKIAEWIDLGAPYGKPLIEGKVTRDASLVTDADRAWWSFRPLAKVTPPVPERNPIDGFIAAKLQEKGLAPAASADRRKLIRRAYFDLIGLPPKPEQVETFVSDATPDAWEKVLDALLASPHYGERWGRHWLDLARYAESHGYEQDYDRAHAYHYRDFVIRALNEDLPYDRFVQWQIAGDELAPDNVEAWKATGFLAAGTHATQITANQAEKERYDELDDMAATIGTSMLGLTVGCARCHDHKFDPIPAQDYYRFISTFTKTVRSDRDLEVKTAEFGERHAAWTQAHKPLAKALEKWERRESPNRFETWWRERKANSAAPALPQPAWLSLKAEQLNVGGPYYAITKHERQPDDSYLVTVTAGTPDTYTFTAKVPLAGISALRLEGLADKRLPGYGPGWSTGGGFKMKEFTAKARVPGREEFALKLADGQTEWDVPDFTATDWTKVFRLAEPVTLGDGSTVTVTMKFDGDFDRRNIGRFRLAISSDAAPAETAEAFPLKDFLAATAESRGADRPANDGALARLFRTCDPAWQQLAGAVRDHARTEPRPELVKALVSSEGIPAVRLHTQGPDFYDETFQLRRGDLKQKQEPAKPGFLQVLSRAPEQRWQTPQPAGTRTLGRRAAMARWITDADDGAGQLAARVIVNRLWQHHFGRGLVATPSDFGTQGDKPSHPELLDWLASELIRGGWRLKPLHKLMMRSETYQQAVEATPEVLAADPQNALFTRRQRIRLEGEVLRDAILAVAGTLDRRLFGPGSLDAAMSRRSIYFQIKRSQLPPMLVTFDAPDTLGSLGLRSSTTVAPQALLLMNNAQIRSSVRAWAKTLAAQPADAVVSRAYLVALGRPPAQDESAAAGEFLRTQTASYQAAGKTDAAELALTDFCQSLVSLNEFVYVE